jgi:Polyketide cyclase / dehydrase and lipid transport
MWEFQHTQTTTATPAQLWAHYTHPESWSEWDEGTEAAGVDGLFAVGAKGWLKPVGGPKTKFRLEEVTEERSFTDVTRLPLGTLRFSHRIETAGEATTLVHRVEITGWLWPLWSRVIGKNVAAGLPAAMRRLAELAEAELASPVETEGPVQTWSAPKPSDASVPVGRT